MKADEVFARRAELLDLVASAGSAPLVFTIDDLVARVAWCRRKHHDPLNDPWFSGLALYAGEVVLKMRGAGARWASREEGTPVDKRMLGYYIESDDGLHVVPWGLLDAGLRKQGYSGVKDAFMTGALLRRMFVPASH